MQSQLAPQQPPPTASQVYAGASPSGMVGAMSPMYTAAKTLFPGTTAALTMSGEDAQAAADAGNYGAALGHGVRGAAAGVVGLADDVFGPAYRGVSNAAKAFFTGEAPPAAQAAQGAPAPAAPAPAAPTSEAPTAPAAAAPTTGAARSFRMANGQKMFTNLTDDAAAVAGLSAGAGMQPPGNPNLGTAEDNLRQLANIRALDTGATGGSAVLDDGTDAANAEKTRRWQIDDMMGRIGKAGTRTERAAMGQAMNTMLAGQNQQEIAAVQAATQRRGQDIGADTARAGFGVQTRGQDLNAKAADGQLGLGMRRLEQAGAEGDADRKVRLQIAEQQAALEGRKLTAAEKAAVLRPKWVPNMMKPGTFYNETAPVPQLYDMSLIGEEPKKK